MERGSAGRIRSTRPLLAAAAGLVVAIGIVFGTSTPGSPGITRFGDLTQLVLSAGAATAALRAGFRSSGRLRASWLWIGAGVGAWSAGQAIWCYLELILQVDPFPSPADVGFLFFPVGVAVGLLLFPTHQSPGIRLRNVLDGIVVVGALTAISWFVVLEATFRSVQGTSGLSIAISAAYPIGDVLIISMVIYSLSRPGPYIRSQLLLAAAMVAMAASDTPFAVENATDDGYLTGSLTDLGWVVAFVLVTVAAMLFSDSRRAISGSTETTSEDTSDAPSLLPYLPLVLAAAVLAYQSFWLGEGADVVQGWSLAIAVVALLGRQYLTVLDNRRLVKLVASREDQLRRQATMDLLTGLTNRALFNDRVAHALELHRRDMRPLALLFCDLDDFKSVNDTFGHPAGDELLIRVSDRLRGALRTGDTLARFGGDEFAILIEDGGESAQVGARIIDALRPPFTIGGTQLSVRVSVGMIELGADEPSPTLEALLTHADIAMYSAKRAGKGQLAIYDPSMLPLNILDQPLQVPLAAAIADGRITAAYQPVVSLVDGSVVGIEALARWRHDGADIPPGQFIPLASRSGLIGQLTTLMLNTACADLAVWSRRLGHHRLQVAVNIPPGLITDPNFPDLIADVMERHQLAPGQLVLEMTEDALLGNIDIARQVTHELDAMKVPLALDDFGMGHSSLLHLQQIPLGSLKIAMSFVAGVDREDRSERLVRALLSLGRDLGVNMIAEGVERSDQAAVLRALGCPMAQGNLFAEPVTASAVEQLVGRSLLPKVLR